MFALESSPTPVEARHPMSLHVHAPGPPPCPLRSGSFEHSGEVSLSRPAGRAAVLPVVPQPLPRANRLKLSPARTVSRAKHAGFTLLRRTAEGAFERE